MSNSSKADNKANADENKNEYKIDQFSDDITCGVCLEQYSTDPNDLKSPRNLPCGHTFCLDCLRQILKNQIIKCPFDSRETKLTSLNELTINRTLMHIIESYAQQKREVINQYQNTINQLQEEIGKEIQKNLKQLEVALDMLNMHVISILAVKNKVLEVIDGLKKIKNQDTQLLFNLEEYKKLENYLNELTTNEAFYKKHLELVEIRLKNLKAIENEFKQTDSIQKLVDYHIYILRLKEYVKEISDEDLVKKNPEGLSTLNEIEEKIMKRLEEIEQKFNVEQLLRYIKKNQKRIIKFLESEFLDQ